MSARRKKLRKGIDSIMESIEEHREKLEEARESGNIGLVNYYEKEIESMKLALMKKRSTLEK